MCVAHHSEAANRRRTGVHRRVPTRETAARLRDHLDYLHGVEAFMNTIQGVSNYAVRQGFLNAGVMDATYSSSPS